MTSKPAERTAPVAAATPGPWTAERYGADGFKIVSEDYGCVAYVHDPFHSQVHGIAEMRATARLIAAAPALRDALAGLLDVLIDGEWGTHGHALADRAARAALALAEGR